jgi:hypothetical protein
VIKSAKLLPVLEILLHPIAAEPLISSSTMDPFTIWLLPTESGPTPLLLIPNAVLASAEVVAPVPPREIGSTPLLMLPASNELKRDPFPENILAVMVFDTTSDPHVPLHPYVLKNVK